MMKCVIVICDNLNPAANLDANLTIIRADV
jgi:hypothetical protein